MPIEAGLYVAAAGVILYAASGTSLLVIFGLRIPAPRVPGTLVLVVGDLLASSAFGLGDRGLTLMGEVPSGLPSLAIPDLGFVLDTLPIIGAASMGLLLIGFS